MEKVKTFNYPKVRKYKLDSGEEGFRLLVRIYKSNAKKKGRDFNLTIEQFKQLTQSNCHYCGLPPKKQISNHNIKQDEVRNRGAYTYTGIDRKDSSQGYTPENSLPCCHQCNIAKMDMTYDEFIMYIERLASFRRNC